MRERRRVDEGRAEALQILDDHRDDLVLTLRGLGNLGSTDMNYQVVDGAMPTFNIGVGDVYTNYHKRDECVSIDELVLCAKAIALTTLRGLC